LQQKIILKKKILIVLVLFNLKSSLETLHVKHIDMNHHLDCVSFVAPIAMRGHETKHNRAQSQAPSSCEKIPLVIGLPNPAIPPPHDRLGLSLELLVVFLLVSRLAALPLPLIFLSKNKSLKTRNNHITYWLWRLSPLLSCVIPSFHVANKLYKSEADKEAFRNLLRCYGDAFRNPYRW
jgi:hypothetical protein